ncbi:MAG TPA: hypothetical protein P5286_05110 [Treponemataceae bacterium]|nr:hypothetical protein [Treponemataceae bacterium]
MNRIAKFSLVLLLFMSCTPKSDITSLELTTSPVISRENRVALVVDPYIALRDKPGDDGITIAHARRGDVFLVEGKRFEQTAGTRVLWIDLGTGWVRESSLRFYSSEARARAAGDMLMKGTKTDDSSSGVGP